MKLLILQYRVLYYTFLSIKFVLFSNKNNRASNMPCLYNPVNFKWNIVHIVNILFCKGRFDIIQVLDYFCTNFKGVINKYKEERKYLRRVFNETLADQL